MNNALIIFVRNPELGKVKTRLAVSIGEKRALDIYIKLLEHTKQILKNVHAEIGVFYSDYINNDDDWNAYQKCLQQGDNLGERMQNSFTRLFENSFEKVCIIGSDCYELTSEIINEAFSALDDNDAVIGPATDGGYYLLGIKKVAHSLFTNKNWSTDTVLNDTITDLQNENKTFQLLDKLSDIDTIEDVQNNLILATKFLH
jgi:uncharacterized protein